MDQDDEKFEERIEKAERQLGVKMSKKDRICDIASQLHRQKQG